ncbi:FtsH protease activity modulator HflK [Candidatus Nitrosacidococcus sp. I8]|uniref:FtsH protease activity modulator HflK n=1 Tax=Candidatus Nitrosacidococcus sp. I8 TaxID=2942908 RepID=UPI002225EBBB|nr:FtsH protease activity modulator HflK [Candidatus Nitrosacidococcus sp. I8]CAH9019687.1 Modulator of FtsH protease HflK [Candidatus Nitrosacidococcus sp. I8]
MAWNEPNGNKDNDSWNKNGDQQGPPDLDEIIQNLKTKLNKFFGNKDGGGSNFLEQGPSSRGLVLLALVAITGWMGSGIYIVKPAERGVVLRFGKYVTTADSGPHWHIPYPIEKVELIDVAQIRSYEIGYRSTGRGQSGSPVPSESLMLTQDENIVDVRIAVQYRIKDAAHYLFNVRHADINLRQVLESALREVVGKNTMDFVLTEGRSETMIQTQALAQEVLDQYKAGMIVTSVNMQDAQPPEQVQEAFADAIKAREDEQRLRNEAEAYANDIIPKARGAAFRKIREAEAYKSQVIAHAQGETAQFSQILEEYLAAPEITEKRLYIEAMESVMKGSRKVLVDVPGSTNVFYLPLGNNESEENNKTRRTISLDQLPAIIRGKNMNQQDHSLQDNNSRNRRTR